MNGLGLVRRAQVMAGFMCGAFYITATTAVSVWKAAGWEGWRIGAAVASGNVAYVALVAWGGRLADRWGGRRTGSTGAAVGIAGCLLATGWPTPTLAWAAIMLVNMAGALCFPSLAGWVARGSDDAAVLVPLHRKVAGYNIGWASGELAGFVLFGLLATVTRRAGFAAGGAALAVVAAVFALTLVPAGSDAHEAGAAAAGEDGPRLTRLALVGRLGLLLGCMVGAGMLAQAEKAFGVGADVSEARRLAGLLLATYAAGIIASFVLLGRWTGWIMAPRRLIALQAGLALGGLGLVLGSAGAGGPPAAWLLAACGVTVGLGFGAAYTGSLYYSLRLPAGASSSAGVHETFIGLGNIAGPVLAGVWLDASLAAGRGGMATLGLFAVAVFVVSAGVQIALAGGPARGRPGPGG